MAVAVVVVEAVAVDISKTSPRRNPSSISANTWKRKCVYASMAVVKVIDKWYWKGNNGSTVYSPCLLLVVVGKLMGYDPLLNLVLDETVEYLKGKHGRNMYICIDTAFNGMCI